MSWTKSTFLTRDLSFNVVLSNFVFSSRCLRVSCSVLLIHISLPFLIRKPAKGKPQLQNIFAGAQKCEKSG